VPQNNSEPGPIAARHEFAPARSIDWLRGHATASGLKRCITLAVNFTVPQYPRHVFRAAFVANAGTVVATTGTVLVQFGLDNTDRALQPGTYADVKFPLPPGANGVRVPATALMFRDEGMQVATVDGDNRVRLKTIVIARDLGSAVDIASGISPTDRIIDNPTDALQDGDEVRVRSSSPQ
jgi:multidrug efflux pump subunit AcrA (membrane-fusion protein)